MLYFRNKRYFRNCINSIDKLLSICYKKRRDDNRDVLLAIKHDIYNVKTCLKKEIWIKISSEIDDISDNIIANSYEFLCAKKDYINMLIQNNGSEMNKDLITQKSIENDKAKINKEIDDLYNYLKKYEDIEHNLSLELSRYKKIRDGSIHDKNQWTLYNRKYKEIENEFENVKKHADTIRQKISIKEIEVKNYDDVSYKIYMDNESKALRDQQIQNEKRTSHIDIDAVNGNFDFAKDGFRKTQEEREMLNNSCKEFERIFDDIPNNDEYEYEKALEKKLASDLSNRDHLNINNDYSDYKNNK